MSESQNVRFNLDTIEEDVEEDDTGVEVAAKKAKAGKKAGKKKRGRELILDDDDAEEPEAKVAK